MANEKHKNGPSSSDRRTYGGGGGGVVAGSGSAPAPTPGAAPVPAAPFYHSPFNASPTSQQLYASTHSLYHGSNSGGGAPPYIEPPSRSNTDHVALQLDFNNLTKRYDSLTQKNEALHEKLGQYAVQIQKLQQSNSHNAQIIIDQRNEIEKLRDMLQCEGIVVPEYKPPLVTPNLDQRVRNLEEFCSKISELDMDRPERLIGSTGGISISNVSLSSSLLAGNETSNALNKDACSTSAYSSLSSLDRLDGISLRERKITELENEIINLRTKALKQDAKGKILEKTLRDRNMVIKQLKFELDQYLRAGSQGGGVPYREFTQI